MIDYNDYGNGCKALKLYNCKSSQFNSTLVSSRLIHNIYYFTEMSS